MVPEKLLFPLIQEALRHHKVEVSKYEAKVRSFYQELEEVLGEDQDLYMMQLTRMQQHKEVDPESGHDEVHKDAYRWTFLHDISDDPLYTHRSKLLQSMDDGGMHSCYFIYVYVYLSIYMY